MTYRRWADSVPGTFHFSVKLPRAVTHGGRLKDLEALDSFLDEASGLGTRLGSLLIQLPPGLKFEAASARAFFRHLRARFGGVAACEPRNATWFEAEADDALVEHRIGRCAVDPAFPVAGASRPGGWTGATYYRLHGSPRRYASAYSAEFLAELAVLLRRAAAGPRPVWCIFNNTARGEAIPNALDLMKALQGEGPATR